ncbi:DUF4136 domain-containing protein [Caldimonas tepidiphila]|uniref:DUF4136 domain-containing protein n=1 Tax=Caldimonas tepidiphila TaxID=2315841 RepID=UPI000E5A949E|nr:DUF4136 domain-containing protein [Caldimonas tepidiphila]
MRMVVAAIALTALLGGCANVRLIESDVSSYGQWPAQRQPGVFAFERLPSQQARAEQQARIEQAALPALEQAGFRPAALGEPASVTVQVGLSEMRHERAPWDDPLWHNSLYFGRGGFRGFGAGVGLGWSMPSPYYVLDAAVLIRDARTQQVLYETRARHDGRWHDETVWRALFEAALKDFPMPAISPRRVAVEVPR